MASMKGPFGILEPEAISPPPLPPRDPPPAYSLLNEGEHNMNPMDQWRSGDPRSSSTQSLVPAESEQNGRRTLLLIYIHGFMGNETSFQSFPAHVHNLLSITLSETHTVHTKIYPRYKSRKAIEFARNDFSKWLEPHENASTDTILLGHSLGGILAAEVALLPPSSPLDGKALHHRILGTISFDTPFLGMHPGVVVSGIGSLFRPAPEPPATSVSANSPGTGVPAAPLGETDIPSPSLSRSQSQDRPQISNSQYQSGTASPLLNPLASPSSNDPNYNPPFPNDVRLVQRKGWGSVLHFVNKHADGLAAATKQYFVSHLEFGGCLADYQGLKSRYTRLRKLEDVDEISSRQEQRVRFLNYYTASTGRPKLPKGRQASEQELPAPIGVGINEMSLDAEHNPPQVAEADEVRTSQVNEPEVPASPSEDESQAMQLIECVPMADDTEPNDLVVSAAAHGGGISPKEEQERTSMSEAQLPPLPPVPSELDLPDLSVYTDKDARKLAEKEQKRTIKAHQQALKSYENAVKDRKKLLEKREKKARQEQDKRDKNAQKEREKEAKEQQRREKEKSKTNIALPDDQALKPEAERPENDMDVPLSDGPGESKAQKPKRDKKFCLLPSDLYGDKDICWVRIYMEGVDEVGAHCGLFTPGKHYENLVGNVGDRVEEWVKEDATRRRSLESEGMRR